MDLRSHPRGSLRHTYLTKAEIIYPIMRFMADPTEETHILARLLRHLHLLPCLRLLSIHHRRHHLRHQFQRYLLETSMGSAVGEMKLRDSLTTTNHQYTVLHLLLVGAAMGHKLRHNPAERLLMVTSHPICINKNILHST